MVEVARALREPARGSLRSVELFAGVGGLVLGLHAAGFKPQLLVEHDELCKDALEANRSEGRSYTSGWKVEVADATTFDYKDVNEVDLLSAGAPCQPFSRGGLRRGQRDERNLFPQVVRALGELEPQAFVIENVRGLLFRDMEFYFNALLRELRRPRFATNPTPYPHPGKPKDEYKVFHKVLDAADFGLPQRRQRLFVVGLKPDLAERWQWPKPTHNRDALLSALLSDEYWERHRVTKKVRDGVRKLISPAARERSEEQSTQALPWRTVRDFLSHRPEPYTSTDGVDPWHVLVPGARLYSRHNGSKLDWPAKTVKAGVHGCPGGEHVVVFDNGALRYFTVRECALLQGFPDDYAFAKVRTPAMRQIGNAVPPPVARAVGEQIAKVLRG